MTKAAELILSQPSAKYQEHTHTHRQLTLHVCMLTSTLTQGESPHLAVDQGEEHQGYINFSVTKP
jgi:hypothetical protein